MIHAAISCAKSPYPGGLGCGQLLIDTGDSSDLSADLPASVAKTLAEHGWSQRGGEHFCPVHDPAQAGDVVEITPVSYRPLGDSGWEVRIPGKPYAEGMAVNIEVRRRPDTDGDPASEMEPVSGTDANAAALEAFLALPGGEPGGAPPLGPDVIVRWPRTEGGIYGDGLTLNDLRALLAERGALRAFAPASRELEDPFYRPGGVYVSANGWWRFTCKVVVAGVAIGVEECLKDRLEPRFTKRNIWRSVRAAGCDFEVNPETGERLAGPAGEE